MSVNSLAGLSGLGGRRGVREFRVMPEVGLSVRRCMEVKAVVLIGDRSLLGAQNEIARAGDSWATCFAARRGGPERLSVTAIACKEAAVSDPGGGPSALQGASDTNAQLRRKAGEAIAGTRLRSRHGLLLRCHKNHSRNKRIRTRMIRIVCRCEEGRDFLGPSGRLIKRILTFVGMPRHVSLGEGT